MYSKIKTLVLLMGGLLVLDITARGGMHGGGMHGGGMHGFSHGSGFGHQGYVGGHHAGYEHQGQGQHRYDHGNRNAYVGGGILGGVGLLPLAAADEALGVASTAAFGDSGYDGDIEPNEDADEDDGSFIIE